VCACWCGCGVVCVGVGVVWCVWVCGVWCVWVGGSVGRIRVFGCLRVPCGLSFLRAFFVLVVVDALAPPISCNHAEPAIACSCVHTAPPPPPSYVNSFCCYGLVYLLDSW
jgi:hypothetical protein